MPPRSQLLTKQQYATLLGDLRRIIGEGKEEAERAAAQSLIDSFWSIGRRIHKQKLTTPCPFCHLEGEHAGRLRILPPGNNPTWLLGRHPIMRIRNRERTLLN